MKHIWREALIVLLFFVVGCLAALNEAGMLQVFWKRISNGQ